MDSTEILRELTHYQRLPRAALQAASQQRAEMLPIFLCEIDRFLAADADRRAEPNLLFFIFHLLGEWREPSAYRPLAQLLHCGSEDMDRAIGEAVTTTSHRVMAAVFEGDPEPLYGIIRGSSQSTAINPRSRYSVRWAATSPARAAAGRNSRSAAWPCRLSRCLKMQRNPLDQSIIPPGTGNVWNESGTKRGRIADSRPV